MYTERIVAYTRVGKGNFYQKVPYELADTVVAMLKRQPRVVNIRVIYEENSI